jgi:hypothetical protein
LNGKIRFLLLNQKTRIKPLCRAVCVRADKHDHTRLSYDAATTKITSPTVHRITSIKKTIKTFSFFHWYIEEGKSFDRCEAYR